jgi:hypothetical protein|tara:strand:+ start:137 stop:469 length:333 start_codon:yes stop_codon:yes gene_type:complete
MYIINDVWEQIKEYLFHNIKKQGKHLKNDKYIQNYNNTLKFLPKLKIPGTGPRVIYNPAKKDWRIVKFLYYLHYNGWYKLIIYIIPYQYHFCVDEKINDQLILDEYYNNI